MTTEQMLLTDTTDKYNKLTKAIKANSIAEALKNKISSESQEFLDKELDYINRIAQERNLINEMNIRIQKGMPSKGLYATDQEVIIAAKDRVKRITKAYQEEYSNYNKAFDK